LVTTTVLRKSREQVVVRATGTVVPARQVSLKARVSGAIVDLSPAFVPGGHFPEGETILQIDPEDYRLAVRSRKAGVAQAERKHRVELGQQDIAKREWALIEDKSEATSLDEELTLRKPQLAESVAALDAARSALRQAELDLERTTVKAPFSALVLEKYVELGAQVSSQTTLVDLVGTDEYWVQVTLPADRLRWVGMPEDGPGAKATIRPSSGVDVKAQYEGRVIQRRPDLETAGRLAQLIVSVPDPAGQSGEAAVGWPLLLGAYVQVDIEGPALDDVFAVPRTALHEGDRVWLMTPESRLEVRRVDPVWGGRDHVLIREGVKQGERLVLTDLGAPVSGMLLEENAPTQRPQEAGPDAGGRGSGEQRASGRSGAGGHR